MKNKICLFLIVVLMTYLLVGTAVYAAEKLKVAFIYNAVVGDFGWFYGIDKSRKITDEELDFVETTFLENVTPGAVAERVMTELCKDGYNIIVPASEDYTTDVLKVAEKYTNVKFLIVGGDIKKDPNVESAYPNNTQAWYILGQVAGKLTKTNTIGVIAAFIGPVGLRTSNAGLLGAKSVNPDVKERIIYINTFYDPAAEKDAALSLIDAGADVLYQATNTPAHVQAAEEKGVYAMSQYEDMRQFGPHAYVSGDEFIWEKYFIPTFKAIYENSWKPRRFQPDLISGISNIAEFGPMVTEEMKAKVEESKNRMLTEGPDFFWKGPIYDNEGNLRVKEGEKLTEEELTGMNWWVDGAITSK
jgi:basic membrane protein A and related proteins